MKKLIFAIFLLAAAGMAHADLLSEINSGAFRPKSLPLMTSLPDGERYAQVKGKDVYAYSYKTGQMTDTLFHYASAKGEKPNSINGFVLSPNDRYMLVYANSEQLFRRSFSADYYLYDRKRHELRPLTDTMPVMNPVFSPDGKYIAFARSNNLYIYKIDFKTELPVTRDGEEGKILNGTSDWLYEEEFTTTYQYCFSPDSKQLAFVRLNESGVESFTWQDYLQEDGGFGFPVMHSLKYPRAGRPNAVASVVVYDTYYKSLKTMALPEQHESYIPRIRWTNATAENAQGDLLIFRLNRDQNKLEVFTANPKSTVCTRLYSEESKNCYVDYQSIDEWQWLQNNSFICINETSGYRHAYLYSPTGIKQKQLTSGNYDVTCVYGYDEATQTLYYQAADKDPMTRYIYALNTKKNVKTPLASAEGMHQASFSENLQYFVDRHQSVSVPGTYTLYDRNGKKLRELLNNNAVAQKAKSAGLPTKSFFSFTTPRGDKLNGWMLHPLNFDPNKKYPVLFFHYSGPASQQVLNRWRIDWEEYLAAEEEVICVCVDPRGTDARGRAFRNATYMNIGIREAEDQVAAAEYMKQQPYVDSEKIGIWGWSYGGYATIMSMSICGIEPGLTKDEKSPFAFGMAVAPVTDWRLYDSGYTERYMRRPQVNEGGYKQASLIEHADKLQGDLLIMHGMADDNVHVQNALLYTEALTAAGIQYDMQLYPDDNHFLRKRSNYAFVYQRLLRFLKREIKY